jgi:hypothetical protein
VHNFEQMMRIMKIGGLVLSIIGLALCVIEFWIIAPEMHKILAWYQLITQMALTFGIVLTLDLLHKSQLDAGLRMDVHPSIFICNQ